MDKIDVGDIFWDISSNPGDEALSIEREERERERERERDRNRKARFSFSGILPSQASYAYVYARYLWAPGAITVQTRSY